METDKISISNKVSSSEEICKYIIDRKDSSKIRLMCIILSEIKGYTRNFDGTMCLSFWQEITKSNKNIIKSGIKPALY